MGQSVIFVGNGKVGHLDVNCRQVSRAILRLDTRIVRDQSAQEAKLCAECCNRALARHESRAVA